MHEGYQGQWLPLSALLSQALVAFTVEADNEAERRLPHVTASYGGSRGAPWLISLLMWANCLRHLPDEGVPIAELRRRARTGTNLDGMRRWRYVTFDPDPGRGKRPKPDAVITPTSGGIAARDAWPQVTAEVEARWRDRLGPEQAGFPPGETPAAELPLWTLLSRPLLAFAVQYEAESGPSLAVSANVLRVLHPEASLTRDISAQAGVPKEAVAAALGPLRESGLIAEGQDPAGGRGKAVRLTARGVTARDTYPARAAGIERDWRARFGDGLVSALRAALEPLAGSPAAGESPMLFAGLAPHADNWRAKTKPLAALPHYPMTLHRGGFPDGS